MANLVQRLALGINAAVVKHCIWQPLPLAAHRIMKVRPI
jgi:hypothetical protein